MGKEQIYRNLDALEPIKKILGETDEALNDESRTIDVVIAHSENKSSGKSGF